MGGKRLTIALAIFALVVGAPSLYFGAYLANVDRVTIVIDTDIWPPYRIEPDYRFGGSAAETFFGPAQRIDAAYVRPKYWTWPGV